MSAPNPIRSRVINFVACGSGPDVSNGHVNYDLINPNNGETAAGAWAKPQVQIPINLGVRNTMFNCPYGKPSPNRIIRYNGDSSVVSDFHYDARTMSAGLGLTFFEGWATTVAKLNDNYGQRVMAYMGRMFPIFDTTLTPWLWPNDINSAVFQNCPGVTNMSTLSYIRHQIEDFLDNGGAEFYFDADSTAQDVTSGRYDTIFKIADALTIAATYTDADFIGSFANAYARVVGLEALPHRDTTGWAAGKVGMSWLANSDGATLGFDTGIGNPDKLQPDEMDVWPIVQFLAKDATAYAQAMSILETYPNLRVCVKFKGMLAAVGEAAMLEMLALGVVPDDGDPDDGDPDDGEPDDGGEEEAPIVVPDDTSCCSDRWVIIPEVRFAECNPPPVFQRGRAPFLVVELFNETLGETWELEDFQVDLLYGHLTRAPRKPALVPAAPTPGPDFDDDVSPPIVPFSPPPPYLVVVADDSFPDQPPEIAYFSALMSVDPGHHSIPVPTNTFVAVHTFIIHAQYRDDDGYDGGYDAPPTFMGKTGRGRTVIKSGPSIFTTSTVVEE